MKKFIAVFISIFSLLCMAFGVSGCGGVRLDGKKIGTPVNAYISHGAISSTNFYITDKDDFKELCSIFDGVNYKFIEELSEEENYVAYGVLVYFYYLSDETADIYVASDGKSLCWYKDNRYITEAGAVNHEALINLITKLEQEKI